MTEQVQQPTQISEKVTATLLDRMYNNFVKITDWVMKGKESKYPMPKALAWLFDTTEQNASEVTELKSLVSTLQQNLVQKEQRIAQLDTALQGVNTVLKQVVDAVNAQHQQAEGRANGVGEPTATFAPQPAPAPAPAPVDEELVDLDEVVSGSENSVTHEQVVAQTAPVAPQPAVSPEQGSQVEPVRPVSPNEQAIQVSAEAVGAGNIDPASYQALDAEIGALLAK